MSNDISRTPVPDGIQFGDRVVELAYVPKILDGIFYKIDRNPGNPKTKPHYYEWIERGDPLYEFYVYYPRIGIPLLDYIFEPVGPKIIVIESPVSGLVLSPAHPLYSTSILLPDDEPPAEDAAYMFRELFSFCTEHQKFIDFGIEEADLEKIFEEHLSRKHTTVDALENYGDYFTDIRKKHSELRKYIRHLR